MFRAHRQRYAAAGGEFGCDRGVAWRTGGDEIVEDAIGHGFVEGALVAKGGEVEFERFAFDAEFVGHVFDDDLGEVHLSRHRAEGGEIGGLETDGVGTFRRRREGLQFCFARGGGQTRFAAAEEGELRGFIPCHRVVPVTDTK